MSRVLCYVANGTIPYQGRRGCARYKQEKEEEQRKLHGPAWDAMDYIQKGEARTALRSSGVQPVKIYRTESKTKKTLFGLSSRRVEEVVSVQSGWILGELQLTYTTRLYGDDIWEIRNASKRTIYSKKHVHVVNDLKACPILPSNRSTCPQP